jgi:hypothetical protein
MNIYSAKVGPATDEGFVVGPRQKECMQIGSDPQINEHPDAHILEDLLYTSPVNNLSK